jgi:HEAT repeat protein
LARIGSSTAIEGLLVAVSDPQLTARRHAAQAALEELGEEAVLPLLELAESGDWHARRNAAQVLGWIGSRTATEVLVETLHDSSPQVRSEAAWALGQIGDPGSRSALRKLSTNDPSVTVRQSAQSALAAIKTEPMSTTGWPQNWAPVLGELQAVRWLILGLSLAAAGWLVVGNAGPLPHLRSRREAHRQG